MTLSAPKQPIGDLDLQRAALILSIKRVILIRPVMHRKHMTTLAELTMLSRSPSWLAKPVPKSHSIAPLSLINVRFLLSGSSFD